MTVNIVPNIFGNFGTSDLSIKIKETSIMPLDTTKMHSISIRQ